MLRAHKVTSPLTKQFEQSSEQRKLGEMVICTTAEAHNLAIYWLARLQITKYSSSTFDNKYVLASLSE